MSSRSDLKRLTEEDRFSRWFATWASNHGGWRKAKKMNRRLAKRRLKRRADNDFCSYGEREGE